MYSFGRVCPLRDLSQFIILVVGVFGHMRGKELEKLNLCRMELAQPSLRVMKRGQQGRRDNPAASLKYYVAVDHSQGS
jgi:hypothetical protein